MGEATLVVQLLGTWRALVSWFSEPPPPPRCLAHYTHTVARHHGKPSSAYMLMTLRSLPIVDCRVTHSSSCARFFRRRIRHCNREIDHSAQQRRHSSHPQVRQVTPPRHLLHYVCGRGTLLSTDAAHRSQRRKSTQAAPHGCIVNRFACKAAACVTQRQQLAEEVSAVHRTLFIIKRAHTAQKKVMKVFFCKCTSKQQHGSRTTGQG